MKGALVTFIAKVEGVAKEKFSGAEPQTPTPFAPANKNSWRHYWMRGKCFFRHPFWLDRIYRISLIIAVAYIFYLTSFVVDL